MVPPERWKSRRYVLLLVYIILNTLYKLLTHRLAAYLHIRRLVLYLYITVIKVFYSTNIAV